MNKHLREHSCEIRHKSSDNEKVNNGMSEKVQILANNIYKEFERLISFYGSDVVEYMMPLIVSVLENLEELYRIKQSYELELELLKDDNIALNSQYEKEKTCRKQAEERVLQIDYVYEEDKKMLQEKLITSESVIRLLQVKSRNQSDTVGRLEEKVRILKTENQKLYDRYTDILKSHAEQLNRIKAETYREISPTRISQHKSDKTKSLNHQSRSKTLINTDNSSKKNIEIEYSSPEVPLQKVECDNFEDSSHKMFTSDYISHGEETMADILANDNWMTDFTGSGYETDPMIRTSINLDNSSAKLFVESREIVDMMNRDHSLEIENGDSDTDDITDDEFGIGKEIEGLIRENQELVDTKNALNVVKDDLISRLDNMTSENDVLREDLRHHSNREADLRAKVSHLENELKNYKDELKKMKEVEQQKIELNLDQKSFSRSEMAILLEEKNYFKERLMELQDAVVYKEMCRVKKQFPEFKDTTKPVKTNSSVWNLFNHLFKKDEIPIAMEENSKRLISRFKRENDRSQLYSWSIPRDLIESSLPKRIPIPIKIQTIFEPRDTVICATMGYEEGQGTNYSQYLWCLIQSNMKNNKNCYLVQMCLTEKVPELTNKYSIGLQFPFVPFTMAEVPALIYAIKDLNSLRRDDSTAPIETVEHQSIDEVTSTESENSKKIFQTKVQIKNKSKINIGSKTLWFGCEKNQVVVLLLLDNNKVESRLAILTMESEIDCIRYHLGRVFVIEKNGSLGIFDLNKELNQWELSQCLLLTISAGLPISDLCCDLNTGYLWLGSSTNCFILDLSTLNIEKSLRVVEESHLTDYCTAIESMAIVETFSLMLFSVSRKGLLLGYDLKSYKFKVSLDLKPSVFDLIEPIQGIETSTLSLFHLAVDNERIWMTTDCGMVIVVSLDTLLIHLKNQSGNHDITKHPLPTDKVYISSHAFAQCIKIISLLAYSSSTFCVENSISSKINNKNSEMKENRIVNEETSDGKIDDGMANESSKTFFLMTAIGASYVNLNNSLTDVMNRFNHAIIWKI